MELMLAPDLRRDWTSGGNSFKAMVRRAGSVKKGPCLGPSRPTACETLSTSKFYMFFAFCIFVYYRFFSKAPLAAAFLEKVISGNFSSDFFVTSVRGVALIFISMEGKRCIYI